MTDYQTYHVSTQQADDLESLGDDGYNYNNAAGKCYVEITDSADPTVYDIYADAAGFVKYTQRLVKHLIERIPRIIENDDHDNEYWSSVEFLIRVAKIADAYNELKPLYDALVGRDCEYCKLPQCELATLIAPYI